MRDSGALHGCRRLAAGSLAVALSWSSAHAVTSSFAGCQAAQLTAIGRRARSVLNCHAQAAGSGAVDQDCLAQADANYSRSFVRAEDEGCVTADDAATVDSKLSAFVDAIVDDVEAGGGTAKCAAVKLRATGGRTARVLKAYGRTKQSLDYARLARDLALAGSRFLASFAHGEASGECDRTHDAPTIGGRIDAFASTLLCGDDVRDLGEHCDGSDDAVCPGACRTDCTCPSAQAFSCLGQAGDVITLSGTFSEPYRNSSLPSATKIDARDAVFVASPDNRYPINLSGGRGACIAGGTVLGQYGRRLSWEEMHDMNNAGVAFDNVSFAVDGLRVDNVTDGIRPEDGPFIVRQAWLSYVRDDCVENDHLQGGSIEDSLFDGCYVAISERPSPGMAVDGRNDLLTIRRSLLRLEPMPGPRDGGANELGNGRFFKWSNNGTQLALHDNVFFAEKIAQDGASSMGVPDQLVSCSNNVMVWTGPGSYPAPLPSCFAVTTNRSVWDNAVTAWKQQHPHVGAP